MRSSKKGTREMTTAIPQDVLDKDGNMTGIEFYDELGSFIVFAEYDPNDTQSVEDRQSFRRWAYHMLKQMGHTVRL